MALTSGVALTIGFSSLSPSLGCCSKLKNPSSKTHKVRSSACCYMLLLHGFGGTHANGVNITTPRSLWLWLPGARGKGDVMGGVKEHPRPEAIWIRYSSTSLIYFTGKKVDSESRDLTWSLLQQQELGSTPKFFGSQSATNRSILETILEVSRSHLSIGRSKKRRFGESNPGSKGTNKELQLQLSIANN